MADFDDDLLTGAFAEFSDEVSRYVRPAGTAAAHQAVRHRRRVRTAVVGAVAALLIAGPAAAFAAVGVDRHGPPQHVTTSPSATSPSPEPTPSASTGEPPAPDGRISADVLRSATLDIPPWPSDAVVSGCQAGAVTFSGGRHHLSDSFDMAIGKTVYADVDGDGAQETVVQLLCGGQSSTFQVIAFDRDVTGAIRTIGVVVAQTGPVKAICDIRAGTSGGTVDALVYDYPIPLLCNEPAGPFIQQQWRTYGWTGKGFGQVAGPASFPVNKRVTDLAVTATDLVFGAPAGGQRHGSITVTVRNLGPSAQPYGLQVILPSGVSLAGPAGCAFEAWPSGIYEVTCAAAALAPGGARTVTIEVVGTPGPTAAIPIAKVLSGDGYADSNWANDQAQFAFRY